MTKRLFVLAGFSVLASGAVAQNFTEAFDNIGGATTNAQLAGANLEASGWFLQNNSAVRGSTDWFQGNDQVFPSQAGAPTAYIGANFNNTTATNTISNWLVTPNRTFNNGDILSFFTRTITTPAFADRLQVRMSTAGASTNVGTAATDVGDFTTLLLDINPNLTLAGYPNTWTQFNVTVSGLGGPTSGRMAFRYFVPQGGPTGANSDYIGIDTVSYTAVPEPATMAVLGLGAVALLRRRRRS